MSNTTRQDRRLPNNRDPIAGTTLLGSFRVVGRIGAGSVSDVYLARQRRVGNRNVAVKVLKRIICAGKTPEAAVHRKRFLLEAELLGMFKSGRFAGLIDVGVLQDGVDRPFMVMEYLGGLPLSSYLQKGQKYTVPAAAKMVLLLAEGLEELHRFRVVYRDLSPANIIMEEAGPYGMIPRLFDLSHAIVSGIEPLEADGAAGAVLAGTPPYSAPEVTDHRADQRSDVFSLGAVFYAMLTAAPPIALRSPTWDDYRLAVQRLDRVPVKSLRQMIGKVPRGLEDVMCAALAPNPDNRYSSVAEFVADLCEVMLKSPQVRSAGKGGSQLANLITRFFLSR